LDAPNTLGATKQPEPKPAPQAAVTALPQDDDFDWYGKEVIIHEQPATAIYFNPQGALVIRQRAFDCGDDDPFVFISRKNIADFIERLIRLRDGGSV
jgi:hypothetical protein